MLLGLPKTKFRSFFKIFFCGIFFLSVVLYSALLHLPPGAYPGGMHRMPERLVVRKDEAVGNKKKMQICLPKHNYKLTVYLILYAYK